MAPFNASLAITYITTATAILNIQGVNLLTDPVFNTRGSKYYVGDLLQKVPNPEDYGLEPGETMEAFIESYQDPAILLPDLPPIDAVLLSHEDHEDNLDSEGRKLLDGRRVLTTVDGARNLFPRPGVMGLGPWNTTSIELGGLPFTITSTPCEHLPGGEVTGFILESPSFGSDDSGLPNAIWLSGDTIYIPELAEIGKRWHISAAILNLGAATVPLPKQLQITLDGKQAARLVKEIGADIVVPLHFEGWNHFTQNKTDILKDFEEGGIADKVRWLTPGEAVKIF